MLFESWRRVGVVAAVAVALTLTGCSAGAAGDGGTAGSGKHIRNLRRPEQRLRQRLAAHPDRQVREGGGEAQEEAAVVPKYATVNAPGENSATEQASQIRSLVLQKPDMLVVIPASSTALVPAVQEACDAGITVLVLDADMKAPCAHIVRNDYAKWGEVSLVPALKAINGKGDVIINRGVIGSAAGGAVQQAPARDPQGLPGRQGRS